MSETLRFEIPEWVEEDNVADYIAENVDKYTDALDHTASEHDERAQVDEISVTNVELTEHGVTIYYDVEFSAYHGCRDMNYAETDDRFITGIREGRILTFEKHIYPPPRSTYEEF